MNSANPPPASSGTPNSSPPDTEPESANYDQSGNTPEAQVPSTTTNIRANVRTDGGADASQSSGASPINIDASKGEGGGQILRTALALSAVLDVPVQIRNIRANRPTAGLGEQHLVGTRIVGQLAGAKQEGVSLRSEKVNMGVGDGYQGQVPVEAVVKTAGATSLVFQAALPVLLRRLGEGELLHIVGGTSCLFAPTSDYVKYVLVPNLRVFGVDLKYEVVKHGFFPKGGGRVKVHVEKKGCVDGFLKPLRMVFFPKILSVEGSIVVCGHEYIKKGVVDALITGAVDYCKDPEQGDFISPVPGRKQFTVEDVSKVNNSGKCICLTLYARSSAGYVLGSSVIWTEKEAIRRTKTTPFNLVPKGDNQKWQMWRRLAREMGTETARDLLQTIGSGANFDRHMADQIIVFMAMADGTSETSLPRLTPHARSVVDICRQLGVSIHLAEYKTGCRITVRGKGVRVC